MRCNMKSMTGFGRAEVERDGRKVTVEIRSLNHRYLEYQFRLPFGMIYLEERLKSITKKYCNRGRLEIHVAYAEDETIDQREIIFDRQLAISFLKILHNFQREQNIPGEVTIQDLFQRKEFWKVEERQKDEELTSSIIIEAYEQALIKLIEMRRKEGRQLFQDLEKRLTELQERLEELSRHTAEVEKHYRKRLQTRLAEWLEEEIISEERLAAEVALLVEKADISEELTRLDSHCMQFLQIMQQEEAIGRKLDFLIQEMNREVNTIGSKANHQKIASLVVDCKSVLEKMKEQVQNVE